jgi:hypothetical protein
MGMTPPTVPEAGPQPVERPNPFQPSASLLSKLGSIAVHAEEMTSPTGHGFDKLALDSVLSDPEVQDWLEAMRKLAMLPVTR